MATPDTTPPPVHGAPEPLPSPRVAVIGDIGGHADQLDEALVGLGADPESATLPDGLTVVQVGDLVHRGPASHLVVARVDRFLTRYPDRWVQLCGNHESCYVREALFVHDLLDDTSERILLGWDEAGLLRIAAALDTSEGPVLVTHAGLTWESWVELEEPATPAEAVRALQRHPQAAHRPGRMLADTDLTHPPGVLWAEAGHELYASWFRAERAGVKAPFGQVHGHSSAWSWNRNRSTAPPEIAERLEVDPQRRHVTIELAGGRLVGVDPGFGRLPTGRWAPLLLDGSLAV